jgi:ABC-2 type transport system permease protein
MKTTLIVLQREVLIRLKNWRFWLGTLSFPLLFLLGASLPFLASKLSAEKPVQVWVVGPLSFPPTHKTFHFTPIPLGLVDSLQANLTESEAILILPPLPLESDTCQLLTKSGLSAEQTDDLKAFLVEAFRNYRQSQLQITSDVLAKVLSPPVLQAYKLSQEGTTRYSAGMASLVGMFIGFVLFVLLMGGGYQILSSVLEEKSNRLVEYLLLSAPPTRILTGKVLAGLTLSVFQLVIWALSALIGGGLAARWALAGASSQAPEVVSPQTIARIEALQTQFQTLPWLWVLAFTLAGLWLYAFLYAAAGATSDSVTELSGLSQAIQWPLLLSIVMISTLAQSGGGPLVVFLSHFPLTSPIYMPVRLIAMPTPLWEPILSMSILLLSAVVVQSLAARIYQHAILLYGQKLSWKAIWQILRA